MCRRSQGAKMAHKMQWKQRFMGHRACRRKMQPCVGKCNIKGGDVQLSSQHANKCQKTGYWERMCHKMVSEDTEYYDQAYFLASVSNADRRDDQRTVQFLSGATPENETFTLEQTLVLCAKKHLICSFQPSTITLKSQGLVELFRAISSDHHIQRKALLLPSMCSGTVCEQLTQPVNSSQDLPGETHQIGLWRIRRTWLAQHRTSENTTEREQS